MNALAYGWDAATSYAQAAAASRDQRIKELMPYLQHRENPSSPSTEGECVWWRLPRKDRLYPCDCGLASLLVEEEKG
jgi:hypothetical protein